MKTQAPSPLRPALILACLGLAATLSPAAHACTGVGITAQDGSVVVGRTLEFGMPLESSIIVFPAGTHFQGQAPQGKGMAFTSKYGFVGANGFDQNDCVLDGLNEKGLAVGIFYFPGYAGYAEATPENISKGIAPTQFATWLLASFASVAEVQAALDQVALLPVVLPALKAVPGVHVKIEDAAGNCLVIEPIGGKLLAYDNPTRVLTNAPTFPWHLTHLNLFLNQSANYPANRTVNGHTFSPFGMGGGMVGLPGDATPPSRFVRMFIYSQNLPTQPNSSAAVSAAFHLLNNFDIPYGSNHAPAGTAESASDFTTWTSVADLAKLQYHWKTFGEPTVKMVDLTQALEAAHHQPLTLFMGPQKPTDYSSSLDVTSQLH